MKPWSQTAWLNGILALLSLSLAVGAMARAPDYVKIPPQEQVAADALSLGQMPDGTPALLDVDRTPAPLKEYQRIASGSLLVDRVLLSICDPTRIIAFTTYSARSKLDGHRFSGKPHLAALDDVEAVISLSPDLVLLNTHSSHAKVERLREAGLTVFNLGRMEGLKTLDINIRQIATLIGQPNRGERFIRDFHRRLDAVSVRVPPRDRKTAMYLTVLGKQLYGGAKHTSHSDVLRKAGLIDVAAARYEGWPRLSTVQLLELNPQIIAVRTGAGETLCGLPGAEGLQACHDNRAGVVEGPEELWGDAGVSMLPAAEYLFDQVYGSTPKRPAHHQAP